jgi:hypothetical protein
MADSGRGGQRIGVLFLTELVKIVVLHGSETWGCL